jgi:rhomboid-like protein
MYSLASCDTVCDIRANENKSENFTFFFLPSEWQEVASAKGWMVLTGLVALEFINMFTRGRALIDYWAHIGGFLAGTIWSVAYKKQNEERQKNKSWYEQVFRS